VAARENGLANSLSLSLSPSRTLVTPYCKRIALGAGQHEGRGFPLLFPPPFVFRLAPTHLGWDTQRQFTCRSRDPPGRNADSAHHPSYEKLPLRADATQILDVKAQEDCSNSKR
jgi:hypothetical protein